MCACGKRALKASHTSQPRYSDLLFSQTGLAYPGIYDQRDRISLIVLHLHEQRQFPPKKGVYFKNIKVKSQKIKMGRICHNLFL